MNEYYPIRINGDIVAIGIGKRNAVCVSNILQSHMNFLNERVCGFDKADVAIGEPSDGSRLAGSFE